MEFIRSTDELYGLPRRITDTLDRHGVATIGDALDASDEVLARYLSEKDHLRLRGWLQSLLDGTAGVTYLDWGLSMTARKGSLNWSLDGADCLTIWGKGKMPDYTDAAPPPWDSFRHDIRCVVVEDGVLNVGARAFRGCINLEDVSLAPSVCAVGTESFAHCTALETIRSPYPAVHFREPLREEPVLQFGDRAFYGVPGARNRWGEFYTAGGVVLDYFGSGGEVVIPEGIREIGPMVFENRPVSAVTLPKSLERIGPFAFRGTGITAVTLPARLRRIENHAFADTPVAQVIVGGQKTQIHPQAFENTPVRPYARKNKGRWPSVYELAHQDVPGITVGRKLATVIKSRQPFGVRYYNSKRELEELIRDGTHILRLRLDRRRRTVEAVQSFGYDIPDGLSIGFLWPCRREDGTVDAWKRSRISTGPWYIRNCNTQELRPSCPRGSSEWFAGIRQDDAETDTPLALLKQWLALHPDYTVPTEAERNARPDPETDPQ